MNAPLNQAARVISTQQRAKETAAKKKEKKKTTSRRRKNPSRKYQFKLKLFSAAQFGNAQSECGKKTLTTNFQGLPRGRSLGAQNATMNAVEYLFQETSTMILT